MRSGHFEREILVRGRREINASIRRPGEIRFWLASSDEPRSCYIRSEQGIERQIDPLSDEAVVPRPRCRRRLRIGRPLDEAQRWRSRGRLDRCRREIVEVGAPWRARSGISPVYAGRIVDQARSRVARGFRRRRPRSERPRARRPDGTGRSLRSVTRLAGLTRPFLIQWMRPTTSLRASEPEAQADRRIDVDRPSGLKAVGEAVPDFRPHHTGIHIEFLGETEAIIDER